MKKYLMLLLILCCFILVGCSSMHSYTDGYANKVVYIQLIINDTIIEYADVIKYELVDRTGTVYITRQNGEVIITDIKNIILYCKS